MFNEAEVIETVKKATTDALIRSLGILDKRKNEESAQRIAIIENELNARAQADIESDGPWV